MGEVKAVDEVGRGCEYPWALASRNGCGPGCGQGQPRTALAVWVGSRPWARFATNKAGHEPMGVSGRAGVRPRTRQDMGVSGHGRQWVRAVYEVSHG